MTPATRALSLLVTLPLFSTALQAAVDYDIVYVKQPRNGDNEHVVWPEAGHPGRVEPNSDLVLLHPGGSEEVLVDVEHGAVTDPFVSFDGKWVYYSLFYDVREEALNYQRGDFPKSGADIYRINLGTRQTEQLTFQEFTPNTGTGNWDESNPVDPERGYNRLGYGILNTGPAPIAGDKIIFTSNRNGYRPTRPFTFPTMQLFVMDADGSNVTPIAPMTIGSALHPTPLADGRILFSSYEAQGVRDRRLWGAWAIWPDGRKWEPVISAFKHARVFHFFTQLSDQSIVVEDYYNFNNFGFGSLYRIPADSGENRPPFFSAFPDENPEIAEDNVYGYFQMPFTPDGLYSITPLSTSRDNAATDGQGKYTHPSAAPDNDLLVVWSDGPVNTLNRPTPWPAVDAGIYVIPNGDPVDNMAELQLIKNDPNFNEVWPRAVVPYKAIYGIEEPAELEWLPNDGSEHEQLPAGTPYGLIGTSSFYKREAFPGTGDADYDGLDPFNTSENGASSNWFTQGSDAGKYDDSDIWAVRILAMEPNPDRGYGPHSSPRGGVFFKNAANERLRILGEIPLRKFNDDGSAVLDPEGHPDTSFLAKIPADTPFTFQTLDRNGMVLNMAQTWHQVRPGEARYDCGGCHAHSQEPLAFEDTAAAKPGYGVWDLSKETPLVSHDDQDETFVKTVNEPLVNVEFYQDIRPVLQEKCTGCHTQEATEAPASLVLDDDTMADGLPGDYNRLCNDRNAQWGIPPLVKVGSNPRWRQTNASRYVRHFQSRRSLLVWKLFGERLDGWANPDHPSAAVPGDASTLPEGATPNESDLDYRGDIMPVPGHGVEPLNIDEKITFARWIDLGCPIDKAHGTEHEGYGWFADDTRPTLTVASPRAGINDGPVREIRIGFADAYTGIDPASFSVTADFAINGAEPGSELAGRFVQVADGVWSLMLNSTIGAGEGGLINASVRDNQGNIRRIARKFSVAQGAPGVKYDHNGDGTADVLWRNSVTGANYLYSISDGRLSGGGAISNVPATWRIASRGDFNGDGNADIFWRNTNTGDNYLYLMQGHQRLSAGPVNTVPTVWKLVASGDYNGDGMADVLWRNQDTGALWQYQMNGRRIAGGGLVATVADSQWHIAASSDLDGDGMDDLLWRHQGSGDIFIYLLNGTQRKSGISLSNVPLQWQLAGSGDMNGDGTADLLWRNSNTGQNHLYLMQNGRILSSQPLNTVADTNWHIAQLSDLNGDGTADLLWRHQNSGQNWVYLLQNAGIAGSFAMNTVGDLNWEVVE